VTQFFELFERRSSAKRRGRVTNAIRGDAHRVISETNALKLVRFEAQ
jgi:hypothetical protein